MKKWAVGGILVIFVVWCFWLLWSAAVVGSGYMMWRVKGDYGFVLKDSGLLKKMVQRIRGVGGIMGVVMWVEQGVDPATEYKVSIPSKDKPIVPISGCRVSVIGGLLSVVRVEVDIQKVEEVWGDEAERRLNGMTLLCINHGMTRGSNQVFAAGREAIVEEMQGQIVFGVK
jgi:hypothetical protein